MIPLRWEAVPQPRVGEDGERGKQKRSSGDFFDRKKTTCMLYLQVCKCSCWQLEKWNWTIIGCGSGGPSVLWENGPIWGGVYWGELHLAIDQLPIPVPVTSMYQYQYVLIILTDACHLFRWASTPPCFHHCTFQSNRRSGRCLPMVAQFSPL